MAIVSFWSEKKKETAQTLSMIAVATHMAVEHNYKILVIDTYFDNKTISDCYFDSRLVEQAKAIRQLNHGKLDLGNGLSGLAQLVSSGKESPEAIKDYTKVIFKNRLEVLTGNKAENLPDIQRLEVNFKDIIKVAAKYYDYVFVDLQKGLDKPFIKDVLEISDVIVVNITQRREYMESYMKLKNSNEIFKSNKVLPLIGRYDRYSKYTKKNVAKFIGEKGELSAVSYNTLFFESANEGMVSNYFLKFRASLIDSTDRNAVFISEVASTTEDIVNRVKAVQMGF